MKKRMTKVSVLYPNGEDKTFDVGDLPNFTKIEPVIQVSEVM